MLLALFLMLSQLRLWCTCLSSDITEYEAATIIAPVLIYIIWSRRVQMIKTRKWRESIEKQMKNKDEKES